MQGNNERTEKAMENEETEKTEKKEEEAKYIYSGELAELIHVRTKHLLDMVREGWLPAVAESVGGRCSCWDRDVIMKWVEEHRDWVDESNPQRRAGLRVAYQNRHSGPRERSTDDRISMKETYRTIGASIATIHQLVKRGAFPEKAPDGSFSRKEVAEWMDANQDWIEATSGAERRHIGVRWPLGEVAEDETEEAEEAVEEVEDAEEDAEEEEADVSDPVAAIRSIALEAIRAIRAISEGASPAEEEAEEEEDSEEEPEPDFGAEDDDDEDDFSDDDEEEESGSEEEEED